jgi:hypothetical protein
MKLNFKLNFDCKFVTEIVYKMKNINLKFVVLTPIILGVIYIFILSYIHFFMMIFKIYTNL